MVAAVILGVMTPAVCAEVDHGRLLQDQYQERFRAPEKIREWSEGVYNEIQLRVEKIEVTFVATEITEIEVEGYPKAIGILGNLTIKMFGYKDGNKAHVILERYIAVIKDKDGNIIMERLLSQSFSGLKSGWEGIDT